MNPEGMDSFTAVPSMLAEGWTSAFAVGIPRVLAISLVQIKNIGEMCLLPFLEVAYRESAERR